MAKATHVKVSSVWKEVVNVWRNVGGVWKPEVMPYRKVSGVWKECMQYGIGRLFTCDRSGDDLTEINPDTGATIHNMYASDAFGCGGNAEGRLFMTDDTRRYEKNPDTGGTITSSGTHSSNDLKGIGGLSDRVFYNYDYDGIRIREMDPDDLDVPVFGSLQNVYAPTSSPDGVGGTATELFYSGRGDVYEMNPDGLATIRGPYADLLPGSESGIGGINERLYIVDASNDKIYELNPATMALLNNFSSPGNYPTGVGGTKTY